MKCEGGGMTMAVLSFYLTYKELKYANRLTV